MLELPEVLALSSQLEQNVTGKIVSHVYPPTKVHKFCWYNGEPGEYEDGLKGKTIAGAAGFGIFCEISFEGGKRLCFNDGVNVRLMPEEKVPKNYQLMISFEDGTALVFTVAMYGGIILHDQDYDNEYYDKSKGFVSPFSDGFKEYYWTMIGKSKPTLSIKALLATEQRFPGIGNGVIQDILFKAHINPKSKLESLSQDEREQLLECTISVLREITDQGGRDTEKDLFGNPGGYKTQLSKNTWKAGCPVCGGMITKEAYLGGSVYYCPVCQPK